MNKHKLRESFEAWALVRFGTATNLEIIHDQYDWEIEVCWQAYLAAHNTQQVEIDRLMLEFCPDEMTPEQVAKYKSHQKPWNPTGAELAEWHNCQITG